MMISTGRETTVYSIIINPRMLASSATAVMGMSSFFAFFLSGVKAGTITSNTRRVKVAAIEMAEVIELKGLLISVPIHKVQHTATHAIVAIAAKNRHNLKNLCERIYTKIW